MPKMGERMAKLETDVKYIRERLDEFILNADKRYAGKVSERIVYGMVGILLTVLLYKFVQLVVIK